MADLTVTQIAIGAAVFVAFAGYVAFVLRPAWTSYGRLWERFAAGFLSLYILVSLAAAGAAIGLGIFLIYAQSA
ncbi:MAG TPA: hypothetical protein VNT32_09690 [Thermoleophilaceae bacterium]|nr:hypothetical protein [Thermoleophilaceae bacterium]